MGTVESEIAMIRIKQCRLWLFEKRQKERLVEIEDRLPALASDMEAGSLHQQRVKCGAKCRCNNGAGHGPYWFLYRSTPDGLVKRYVRTSEVERVQRRLGNYQEYRAFIREADSIEKFLDVGVAKADMKLMSASLELLAKAAT